MPASMQRESHQWFTERLGRAMGLRVYGHWGMPLLAFPTSGGDEWEMEGQGMVAMNLYLYGDKAAATVARETPLWQAWFQERFPMPTEIQSE